MQQENPNTTEALWEAAVDRLPRFSPTEQQVGIVLLGELARGEPVSPTQLGRALGTDTDEAAGYLTDSSLSFAVYSNQEGSALGFFGLSTVPTDHRLVVNGRTLWTWCAVDTLFLPALLDVTASVESKDPVTGVPITLTVSPTTIDSVDPEPTVVSVNSPRSWETTSATRLIVTACHYIHFFVSPDSGRRWTDTHPDTVLLSVEDAFAFGQSQNTTMFGTALSGRARGPR